MRSISILITTLAVLLSLPALSMGQEETASPGTAPAPDWNAGKGATASIEILGPGGTSLRRTYGVVLGEPGRLVLRLTDLAGGEKAIATFRDGRKADAFAVYALDPVQDIAILETTAPLPSPPEPALAIKWRPNAKVFVLPGADMGDEALELTVTEPFEQGKIRVVPLSGDLPGGLAVMDVQGKWIGLTGRFEDIQIRLSALPGPRPGSAP